MSTWFDRLRGESQGRITSSVITPTTGSKIFVLGAEQSDELATLQANDYTEVFQTLDLTGIDIAGATLDTLGVVMQQFEHPVGMVTDSNTLALWNMDENYVGASNLIQPGVDLYGQGDLAIADESYSAVASRCRNIPAGSSTAFLEGLNSPILIPGAMLRYTLLWWMNFDSDAYADSNGIDPTIFKLFEGNSGLEIGLAGETGVGPPHRWWPYMKHGDGAATETRLFTGYEITTSPGWKMYAIVYDSTLVGVNRAKLYVDGTFVTNVAVAPTLTVAAPSAAALVRVADPELTGYIDQMKFSSLNLTPTQVSDEYDACTDPQTVNDAAWKMSVRVDDVVYCERTIAAGETRRWRDFYAPVRHLTGSHKIAFRLQLEEV